MRSAGSFVRTHAVAVNTVRSTVIPRACRVSTANDHVFTDGASVSTEQHPVCLLIVAMVPYHAATTTACIVTRTQTGPSRASRHAFSIAAEVA